MTIRELQDRFVKDMEMFDVWPDKFNYLISEGENLPAECPEWLLPFRIQNCQSKTCFTAYLKGDKIYTTGWNNSAVMRGIIAVTMEMFDNSNSIELKQTDIDFHIKSELIDNLTSMRRAAVEEMIRRINIAPFEDFE